MNRNKLDANDIISMYFISKVFDGHHLVQAWTDDKELLKAYMEFHKCEHFKVKKITNTVAKINVLLEENYWDEIQIYNIVTRDKSNKHNNIGSIFIPATETEIKLIREECATFMASRIDYSFINDALPYLKERYQNVLKSIFLDDVIKMVVYSKPNRFTESITFDELILLIKSFPENFGI